MSSSSATACAACKYQRKKCTKSCLLAPYFPQERHNQFLNAHKLFGVSNITKMIKGVQECQRDTAMHNLIFHANARAIDPVGGVYKIMCDLKRKIECFQDELNLVNQQLAMCRSFAQQQHCYSYGDLLEHGEEYVNVDGHDHQNQQHQETIPLNYETFLDVPSKVKLENDGICVPEQTNILSQILMP